MAENPVFEFLGKEENLQVAFEVEKHLNDFRVYLHQRFWPDFEKTFRNRLELSPFKMRWDITGTGTTFDYPYRNLVIHPCQIPNEYKGSCLGVGLQQGDQNNNFAFSYGLVWRRGYRPDPETAQFRTLIEISKKAGFSDRYRNNWWPACRYLDLSPRNDAFILQYAPHPEVAINSLIDTIWKYFELVEPTLSLVNMELIQGK